MGLTPGIIAFLVLTKCNSFPFLTNKSGQSVNADAMIEVQSGQGENVYLIKGVQIPSGSSLEVISGKVVVANTGGGVGDTVQVRCDTASALDATLSILENT